MLEVLIKFVTNEGNGSSSAPHAELGGRKLGSWLGCTPWKLVSNLLDLVIVLPNLRDSAHAQVRLSLCCRVRF